MQVWHLRASAAEILDICRELMSTKPVGLVRPPYSNPGLILCNHEFALRETMRGAGWPGE